MARKTIAIYGDTPTVPTGFGRVVKDVFTPLASEFDIKIFGINYNGYPHNTPFEIYPAALPTSTDPDPYGRAHFLKWAKTMHFDLLFMINDGWLLRNFMPDALEEIREVKKDLPIVLYFPVDVEETEKNWYSWIPDHITVPVTYTNFARDVVVGLLPELKEKLLVIPHGVDAELFKPLPQSDPYVTRAREIAGNRFAFLNVNRNQVRKNIPGTIRAMDKYLGLTRRDEESDTLVLHMQPVDPIGCHIELLVNTFDFPKGKVRVSASRITEQELNYMYNGCGACITTSTGEGWGLSISEALTAGVPVIAPRHTSLPEVVREFGMLYDPGIRHAALPHNVDRSNWRYYADPEVVAAAMLEVRTNYDEWRTKAMAGRQWYLGNGTWKHHVAPMWRSLFRQLLS